MRTVIMIDPGNYDPNFPVEEFKHLEEVYANHNGHLRNMSLGRMVAVYRMMLSRYEELYLCLAASPGKEIITLKNQEDYNEFITNLDEKILLATASMVTCIDFIKKVPEWEEVDYFVESRERFYTLMKEPNIAFLKKLRQYLNSYGLIPWRIKGSLSPIKLDTSELLNYKQWNTSNKKIIQDLNDGVITLEQIIKEYGLKMTDFWHEVFVQLSEINANDLEDSILIKKQMEKMLSVSTLPTMEEWKQNQYGTKSGRIIS